MTETEDTGHQIRFTVDPEHADLESLVAELSAFGISHGLPGRVISQVHLTLDELISNAINYGFHAKGPGRIQVEISYSGETINVRVEDNAPAFNPLSIPPPDLDSDLDERAIGGLGLYLTRQMMDRVEYERVGDRNVVTLGKRVR